MNQALEIPGQPAPPDFAYELEDGQFSDVQYHALCAQPDEFLIPCAKILYNGKPRLIYLPGNRKPLRDIPPRGLAALRRRLWDCVDRVRENEFLRVENIAASPDRIYADEHTGRVSLTYFPLKEPLFPDEASFRREWEKIAGPEQPKNKRPALARLVGIGVPYNFTVDKDEYILGRDPERVDGAPIQEENISRVHCRVSRMNDRYTVTDMESARHTYLNDRLLEPNRPYPIRPGDVLKLDTMRFRFALSQENAT
ncbi:MAG: FHA domain-containing protein [Oscillibacter sp.]|nr:FHA domain-containing protein [Oscillibacter sp.]